MQIQRHEQSERGRPRTGIEFTGRVAHATIASLQEVQRGRRVVKRILKSWSVLVDETPELFE
jgi:hypothetical protein